MAGSNRGELRRPRRWHAGVGTLAVAASVAAAPAGVGAAPELAPVAQLPPGLVALARVSTPDGPVALTVHRIRYLGKVRLCLRAETANSAAGSCATYPLGANSGAGIGHAPVWWGTAYVGGCTRHHFQVIGGLVLRTGLTARLHTPAGVSRMPTATVPTVFGVAGDLVYALIDTDPDSVTLTNAADKVVYAAKVESVAHLPTLNCSGGSSSVGIAIGGSPGTIP